MAFSSWILASRIKTLPAALSPILMGLVLAYTTQPLKISLALITMSAAICIQVGTNFANDYFDFIKGADTPDRLGPPRMTQTGAISPQAMKWAFIVMFILAFIQGLVLV